MGTLRDFRTILLTLLLSLNASAALSDDSDALARLLNEGELRIKSWVTPAEGIIVTQQVTLHIEVATATWFTGGTRIGALELDGAVVLRREKFAVNSTERRDGQTFTVQQWSLEIYPQRPGPFDIPPLKLSLSVAADGGGSLQGSVTAPATGFTAAEPPGIGETTNWIATDSFEVQENYNRALTGLEAGDAIQRQVAISAENVAAMMLPAFQAEAQPGLAVYQKPPQIADSSNRGSYRARRSESITYVIEKPGRYLLPAHTFYWWDLASSRLESFTLPEQVIEATGAAATTDTGSTAAETGEGSVRYWPWLLLVGVVAVALLAWFLWRRKQASSATGKADPAPVAKPDPRALRDDLQRALAQQDWPALVQALYRWLDYSEDPRYPGTLRGLLQALGPDPTQASLDALMLNAYYDGAAPRQDIETFVQDVITQLERATHPAWWQAEPVVLKLN